MTVAQRIMQMEEKILSPYATLAANSKGRKKKMDPCELRTPFQRDRDRILHSKGFRRLKHKTQVFLSPKSDHFRTRLTHTLEVSQVARTIARALELNEDLAEAIALGHDLGHTPFGHIGESALNKRMPDGFIHNFQSVRMVEKLENDGAGLNLCYEVIDGIAYHSGKKEPETLEGFCVRRADRIAYINHDIDDAIRGGVIRQEELPSNSLKVLGYTHGERINTMIADIVHTSANKPYVRMSEEVQQASDELRNFMFENVYHDKWRRKEEERCEYIIFALFDYYEKNPQEMPNEFLEICESEGTQRAICDFISCMTDRYAIDYFSKLYVPREFTII